MSEQKIAVLSSVPEDDTSSELMIPNPDGVGGVTVSRSPSLVSEEQAGWIKSAELPDGFKVDVRDGKKDERERLAAQAAVAGGQLPANASGDTTPPLSP